MCQALTIESRRSGRKGVDRPAENHAVCPEVAATSLRGQGYEMERQVGPRSGDVGAAGTAETDRPGRYALKVANLEGLQKPWSARDDRDRSGIVAHVTPESAEHDGGARRTGKVNRLAAGVWRGVRARLGCDLERRCALVEREGEGVAGRNRRHYRRGSAAVSYTHLRAHETRHDLVCRLLLE